MTVCRSWAGCSGVLGNSRMSSHMENIYELIELPKAEIESTSLLSVTSY